MLGFDLKQYAKHHHLELVEIGLTIVILVLIVLEFRLAKDEQARRLEELAKRPVLSLSYEGAPITAVGQAVTIVPRDFAETSLSFEVTVQNTGKAPARAWTFRVGTPRTDVKLECRGCSSLVQTDGQLALLNQDLLRLGNTLSVRIFLQYSRGPGMIPLWFNADGENFDLQGLGNVIVLPPAPPDVPPK